MEPVLRQREAAAPAAAAAAAPTDPLQECEEGEKRRRS